MREALKKILPEKIRTRMSKLGFVTAEDEWIKADRSKYEKELIKACVNLKNVVDGEAIMKWWNDKDGQIENGEEFPWRMICASHWVDVFGVEI